MVTRFVQAVFVSSLIMVSSFGAFAQTVKNKDFGKVLKENLRHDVPEIDVTTLEAMEDYILLDCRTPEEYEVSRIAGARYIGFNDFNIKKVDFIRKNQSVVLYCSVGSRSEGVARIMIDNGYMQVFNLYGGIFEWGNQGKPLVKGENESTIKVHGVTKEWAKWLNEDIRVLSE